MSGCVCVVVSCASSQNAYTTNSTKMHAHVYVQDWGLLLFIRTYVQHSALYVRMYVPL